MEGGLDGRQSASAKFFVVEDERGDEVRLEGVRGEIESREVEEAKGTERCLLQQPIRREEVRWRRQGWRQSYARRCARHCSIAARSFSVGGLFSLPPAEGFHGSMSGSGFAAVAATVEDDSCGVWE
ncbi:hypothetical protein ABZP36_008726 [Zizania latifolia]